MDFYFNAIEYITILIKNNCYYRGFISIDKNL